VWEQLQVLKLKWNQKSLNAVIDILLQAKFDIKKIKKELE
jgi:hypothetical protein